MDIQGTGGIISDNSSFYLLFLQAVILHADGEAIIKIVKHLDRLTVIVEPQNIDFRQDVLKNILSMHKMLGIKPIFSKSTQIQRKLIFYVEL